MAKVLVPIAEGCEELEAVTIIDLLRRAGIEVIAAGLEAGPVKASRGVVLIPDTTLDEALSQEYDMVVLPIRKVPTCPFFLTNCFLIEFYQECFLHI